SRSRFRQWEKPNFNHNSLSPRHWQRWLTYGLRRRAPPQKMVARARKSCATTIIILNGNTAEIFQMAFYFAACFSNRALYFGLRLHFKGRMGGLFSRF